MQRPCVSPDQTLYSLLDIELPESLQQEKSGGQRIQLRDRLFLNVSVREQTDEGFGPAREYALRDLSADGMSISSPHPMAVGRTLEVEGNINHCTWKGRLEVVHCTPLDDEYKVGMKLIEPLKATPPFREKRNTFFPDVARIGQSSVEPAAESCLEQVEIDLNRVRNAFLVAENTWEQLGRTARRLILKAAGELPRASSPRPETETNQRRHPRQATSLDAGMVVMGSDNWHRLGIRVTNVSEGGLGGEIAKDQLNDDSAAQAGAQCAICVGLPVMMAFGSEPDTIWLPAEITHCDNNQADKIAFGVQFVTPMALQFFGA